MVNHPIGRLLIYRIDTIVRFFRNFPAPPLLKFCKQIYRTPLNVCLHKCSCQSAVLKRIYFCCIRITGKPCYRLGCRSPPFSVRFELISKNERRKEMQHYTNSDYALNKYSNQNFNEKMTAERGHFFNAKVFAALFSKSA